MSLLQRNTIVSALFAAMALPALAQTAAAPAPVQAAPVATQTEQARPAAHGRHHQRHDGLQQGEARLCAADHGTTTGSQNGAAILILRVP